MSENGTNFRFVYFSIEKCLVGGLQHVASLNAFAMSFMVRVSSLSNAFIKAKSGRAMWSCTAVKLVSRSLKQCTDMRPLLVNLIICVETLAIYVRAVWTNGIACHLPNTLNESFAKRE